MCLLAIIPFSNAFGAEMIDVSMEKSDSIFPDWIQNIFKWYGEGILGDQELINAIQYLIDGKIMSLENDVLQNNSDETYQKTIVDLQSENLELQNRILDLEDRKSNKIITYSFDVLPDYADVYVINDAVDNAFHHWERINPELDYLKVDKDGDMTIKFWKVPQEFDDGITALGQVDSIACFDDCTITLAVGDLTCHSKWSQFTETSLQEIMMHEIGHTIGVEHTSKYPHIMYASYAESQSDELGYLMPKNIEEIPHTISQDKLFIAIESHEKKIDEVLRPWGLTLEEYHSGEKIPDSDRFYMESDQVVNPLIMEYNELLLELDCYTVHDKGFD